MGEWWPALEASFLQAMVSAFGAMILGFILFGGLQSWRGHRLRPFAEGALLLPNMIPPLFLALGLLNLVSLWMKFPYGFAAVVCAHFILNGGLVAVALDRLVHAKAGGMAEVCWVLGVKPFEFWRRVAWPYLRGDLACLFLFVFSLCFTSFSLPLLLSGERTVTLEVAIFDSVRMDGRWDKAVLLAAIQSSVLFLLAWLLPHPFWPARAARAPLSYLAWPRGRYLVFLPVLILVAGWAQGFWRGWISEWPQETLSVLVEAGLTTFAIALGVGLLHFLLFLLIAFVSPSERLRRFLNGYLSPSPVIAGFAMLLLPGEGDGWDLLKVMVALTLISVPLLYRWIVHSALEGLRGQIGIARTLGASWFAILVEVVWPQVSVPVARACGLAALWASGDFALTGILAGDLNTLPLVMDGLIGSYRMEAAQVLMLPLFAVGLCAYFFFVRMGRYVAR